MSGLCVPVFTRVAGIPCQALTLVQSAFTQRAVSPAPKSCLTVDLLEVRSVRLSDARGYPVGEPRSSVTLEPAKLTLGSTVPLL